MSDLSGISNETLFFDRQEMHNDLAVLAIAKLQGVDHYTSGSVDDRIDGNLRMIETIRKEFKRRGIDPADYDSVKGVRR